MSFDSYEEIIKFAIEKEKEAAAFYEDASRQEPYSGAKE
ncbi:MAG: rubrerythrin, partial [Nitrospira bacterium SG8_3]